MENFSSSNEMEGDKQDDVVVLHYLIIYALVL